MLFRSAACQVNTLLNLLDSGGYERVLGLSLPNILCTHGALVLLALGARRVRPSYMAYGIAYYVVAIGPTWLLSAPRYLAALFPLGLCLGSLTEKRRADDVCTIIFTVFFVLYEFMLVRRWQVW